MAEPFDAYADAFTITISPWGSHLRFGLRAIPEEPPLTEHERETINALGAVRMSNEHMKVMVFMLRRQVALFERSVGSRYEVPPTVLAALNIQPEDWNAFWSTEGET